MRRILKSKASQSKRFVAALGLVVIAGAKEPPARMVFNQVVESDSVAVQHESLKRQRESLTRQLSSTSVSTGSKDKTQTSDFIAPLFEPVTMECGAIRNNVLDSLISSAAKRNDLSPAILRAVIRQESGFKPCAVSYRGAQGLMQLMPETAHQLGVPDPFDPKQNIDAGAYYLKQLLDKYAGDVKLALSAYNAGATRVDLGGGVPDLPETQNYVASVCSALESEGGDQQAIRCEPPRQPASRIK